MKTEYLLLLGVVGLGAYYLAAVRPGRRCHAAEDSRIDAEACADSASGTEADDKPNRVQESEAVTHVTA